MTSTLVFKLMDCSYLQVHTLISCLQAVKAVSEPVKAGDAALIRPHTLTVPPMGKGHGTEGGDDTSIGVSMYHSAVGSLFGGPSQQGPIKGASLQEGRSGQGSTRRSLPDLAQRLLVASEKQISAKFSIAEVLLSLNSRGEEEYNYGTSLANQVGRGRRRGEEGE